ncbi:MAG: LUD domain-containing protein [Solirubrobacterales bacterium]
MRAALSDLPAAARTEPAEVPRAYERDREATPALRDLFAERVGDYRAAPLTLAGPEGIGATVSRLARARGARRLVVPTDLPEMWGPADLELTPDEGSRAADLDRLDGVLTGCAVAIAETGTIAFDGGATQGRRMLTLVPDWHICVVFADQLVAGVPEAILRLSPAAREGRPITLISGPSATSDIELERVEGVHGPRTLDLLIVDRDNPTKEEPR